VITNLIDNAIKFTETGEIFVKVALDDEIHPPTGQTALKFQVSDSGTGIAANVLPTLFEPFIQADSSLTREHEGSGLGLAICKRLVELMHGRIWATSTPGKGSTFYFTVLLEIRDEDKSRFSLPGDLHGLKALVVDDSTSARQMMEELLQSLTFQVSSVQDGQQAIEELRKAASDVPYQLVLLDWKMPGIDGIETARRIRKLDNQNPRATNHEPRTPIIILVTAYGLELMNERIEENIIDASLLKPVKPSELFNTIMAILSTTDRAPALRVKPKQVPQSSLYGRRVLVVEDSALNLDVVAVLLDDLGLIVETAENGRIAVNKVINAPVGHFDTILMDIQMPIMDGFEATKRLREWESTSQHPETEIHKQQIRVPIIALTAHALKGEKEKCLAAGMDDYIAKPIDEKNLHQVLAKWIESGMDQTNKEIHVTPPVPLRGVAAIDMQGALDRLGGRKDLYLRIVQRFESEFGKVTEEISRSMTTKDRAAAERTAHTVKGAAASIGAMALSQAAEEVEKAIANESPDWEKGLPLLKRELEASLSAIGVYLDNEQDSTPSVQTHKKKSHILDQSIDDLLSRLADLLAAGDMAALDAWEAVKEPLRHSADKRLVADLDKKIDRLNFSEALRLLRISFKVCCGGHGNDN
jgi:CheY-like chemotaxis protein/HPt (histidine-containing phosphotransfer) domain-containing protein